MMIAPRYLACYGVLTPLWHGQDCQIWPGPLLLIP